MTFWHFTAGLVAAFGLGVCACGLATAGDQAAQASIQMVALAWIPFWAGSLVMAALRAKQKGGAS